MANISSNINTGSYVPIGLTVPFTNSPNGYFAQSFDTNTKVKYNLINFLNTKKGERRMMPEFGTSLYDVLFEQYDANTQEIAKNILTKEISQWIPEVNIKQININTSENTGNPDNYMMYIQVIYQVINTQQQDSISFVLKNNKI